MKDFFKQNKNIIFICTYVIILLALMLNYVYFIDTAKTLLGVLKPLYMAVGIAFVLNIPMRMIESGLDKIINRKSKVYKFKRTFAILLTLIFAMLLLYLLMIIIIPKVADSLSSIFANFDSFAGKIFGYANQIFEDLNIDFKFEEVNYIEQLKKMNLNTIFNQSLSVLSGFADGFISNIFAFTSAFFQWFLGFCLSLYLLHGKERYISQIKRLILAVFDVPKSKKIFEIGTKSNFVFTKFVGGQLVDCIIKGVMFYIVFLIMDVPFPELLAVIITVCSIVPVFGPIVAMVIDFIVILAFDPLQALLFIVVFQVLSNLESQIIYPKIVGKSIGLPGIWVLLSIFVLGDLFGVLGMLLAVPITALVYELFSEYVKKRLVKKKIVLVDNEVEEGEFSA